MNIGIYLKKELDEVETQIKDTKNQLLLLAGAFQQCSTLEDPRIQCYLDGTEAGNKVLRCLFAQRILLLKIIDEVNK